MKNKTFCFQILHVHRAHMKYYHSFLNLAQVCEKKVKTMIFVSGPPVRAFNSMLSWPENQVRHGGNQLFITATFGDPLFMIQLLATHILSLCKNITEGDFI